MAAYGRFKFGLWASAVFEEAEARRRKEGIRIDSETKWVPIERLGQDLSKYGFCVTIHGRGTAPQPLLAIRLGLQEKHGLAYLYSREENLTEATDSFHS